MDDLSSEFDDEVVDWEVFSRARSELGAGFVRILGYFREDGEKAVDRIEEAMRRGDAAALIVPAHTIASQAIQFGAEPLGEVAETIEEGARSAVEGRFMPDELIPEAAKLRSLYTRTMEELEREANPLRQRRRRG